MSDLHYDHSNGKAYCEMLEMPWDEDFASRIDELAHEAGLNQEQWDLMVREYAWRVKWMFTPTTYSFTQRIMLALHFLNPFAKELS